MDAKGRLRSLVVCVTTGTLAAVLFLFDGAGGFIYLSYLLAFMFVALFLVLSLLAWRPAPLFGLARYGYFGPCAMFIGACINWPFAPTSARKRFYVRAGAISPGVPVAVVRRSRAGCQVQENPDSISFFYWAGPGTSDVVVVRVTPDRYDGPIRRVLA